MPELYGDLGEVFKNPERQNESDQGGNTSLLLTRRSFCDFPRGVFNEFLVARSITLTAILGKVLLSNHHGVLPQHPSSPRFRDSAQFVPDVVVLRADR
jgi:hypothetical protein